MLSSYVVKQIGTRRRGRGACVECDIYYVGCRSECERVCEDEVREIERERECVRAYFAVWLPEI